MPTGIYPRKPRSEETRLRISEANKGKITSEETRLKLSKALKGRPLSEETRLKLSEAHKGKTLSEEHRRKLSEAKKGKSRPEETRLKLSLANKGKPCSEETRLRISLANKGKRNPHKGHPCLEETRLKLSEALKGAKCHLWRGGITPINKIIRTSLEYRLWREAVFARDNYTCKFCGKRGGEIHADHIKPFSSFSELRLDIDNGRTLCIPCHKTTSTYAGRTKPPDYIFPLSS